MLIVCEGDQGCTHPTGTWPVWMGMLPSLNWETSFQIPDSRGLPLCLLSQTWMLRCTTAPVSCWSTPPPSRPSLMGPSPSLSQPALGCSVQCAACWSSTAMAPGACWVRTLPASPHLSSSRAGGKVPFPLCSCWQTRGGLQSHSEFPPGVWNNNPADDFQMPNGTNIPVNSSEEDVFCYGMTCKSELGNQPGHPTLWHLLAMHWLERFGHRAKLMPKEPFNLFTTTWKPALIRANLKNTRSYP